MNLFYDRPGRHKLPAFYFGEAGEYQTRTGYLAEFMEAGICKYSAKLPMNLANGQLPPAGRRVVLGPDPGL